MSGMEGFDPVVISALAGGAALAGKGASDEQIEQQAARILRMGGTGARTAKRLARYADPTLVRFPAIVVGVEIEASTTRGLIHVYTGPSKDYPSGIEPLRTDRTDNQGGMALVERAHALVGKRTLVWKVMEPMDNGSGRDVRIVLWLGGGSEPDPEQLAEAQAAWGKPLGASAPAPQRPAAPRTASDPWQGGYDPSPTSNAAAAPAQAAQSAPMVDEDRERLDRWSGAAENGPVHPNLPEVKVPKGVIPGDKPTEQQLAAIANLLGKLAYAGDDGRVEVYALLGLEIPGDGQLTLKAIPTWYAAAQLQAYFAAALNAKLKARRAS